MSLKVYIVGTHNIIMCLAILQIIKRVMTVILFLEKSAFFVFNILQWKIIVTTYVFFNAQYFQGIYGIILNTVLYFFYATRVCCVSIHHIILL